MSAPYSSQPIGLVDPPATAPPSYPGYPPYSQPNNEPPPAYDEQPNSAYGGAKLPPMQPYGQQLPNYSSAVNERSFADLLNCPPGLEHLTEFDKFVFNQNIYPEEAKNKYVISNGSDEKVFIAVEEYNKCNMVCCSSTRSFDMRVFDSQEREVINIHRPLRCNCFCFPCCLQSLEVTASGTLCGFVKKSRSLFVPKLKICDATGKTVLLIKGPSDRNYVGPKFKILSNDGKTEVGHIYKLLPSAVRNELPNAKHFSISFPMDLDVNIKAVLMAAAILIDCLYFKTTFRNSWDLGDVFSAAFQCGFCLGLCLFGSV